MFCRHTSCLMSHAACSELRVKSSLHVVLLRCPAFLEESARKVLPLTPLVPPRSSERRSLKA